MEDPDAGRKVEALRRCAFRVLPSTLIIHLKRFEFDLATMDRKKVNDYISFPTDLNMYPYTEEGLSSKESKSRLYHSSSLNDLSTVDGKDDVDDDDTSSFGDEGYVTTVVSEGGGINNTDIETLAEPTRPNLPQNKPSRPLSIRGSSTLSSFPSVKPESYYRYRLAGIVAHVGAIDRGHYYSFIRMRGTGKWMEFNDRSVMPFSDEVSR